MNTTNQDLTALPSTFRGRTPTSLAFGTSGLRGLITDITDLEAYINTRGFLAYLFHRGELQRQETVYIGGDLRPSTDSLERSIMRAVAGAIEDAGLKVDNQGLLPTPALAYYAMVQGQPSIMITGSHIPFDRNGIKFYKTSGEVLKDDETGILEAVAEVRQAEYARPAAESIFADSGMFKPGQERPLPPANEEARHVYIQRYEEFFAPQALKGLRIVFFQHSAVGRDLLVEILRQLGAEVFPIGRSEEFVSLDTEDMSQERLEHIQQLVDEVVAEHGTVDAVVSTDGDSDRPLLLGIRPDAKVQFFGGDLLGIVVADYLAPDFIAVPISANDAVDRHFAKLGLTPRKTKIGSPSVIAAMYEARETGKQRVVGWEANGGFMTGSAIERNGKTLKALPTRDACLPLLVALSATIQNNCSLVDLFAELPPRFSKAGLIDQFPQETSRSLIQRFSPPGDLVQVDYATEPVTLYLGDGREAPESASFAADAAAIKEELQSFLTPTEGFGEIARINALDGVRITFANGEIAHIRPSGNAPQLRIYAVADTQARADEIVARALQEPHGILRRLEASVVYSNSAVNSIAAKTR
jgi:phosphomannomutase